MIVLQALYVLCSLVWLFVTAMSLMGFNDSHVFQDGFTWFLIVYLISYPIGVIAAFVGGWMYFRRKKYAAALLWNAYPLLWLLFLIGIFAFA